MQVLVIGLSATGGFAAGVVFSGVVRLFIDREVAALRAEVAELRAAATDLGQKIAKKL